MPFAPNVSDQRGQLLAQGIGNMSQAVAAGMKEYQANKERDAHAQGVITAIIQQNPDILKSADDRTQSLFKKFGEGNTGLKDNIFLAGWAATAQKQASAKQEAQMRQRQAEMLAAQTAEIQRQQREAMQNEAAMRFATASPTAEAIQGGANFASLVNRDVPTQRSAPEMMERFAQRGGMPTGAVNQFFNTRADYDAAMDANNVRAMQAQRAAQAAQERLGISEERLKLLGAQVDLARAKIGQNFKDGDTKKVEFNGVSRTAVFSNGQWLDDETRLPIATKQYDPTFGTVIADGVPNPVLFGKPKADSGALPGAAVGDGPAPAAQAPAAPPSAAEQDKKFQRGKTYTDGSGRRARYLGNGKWKEL